MSQHIALHSSNGGQRYSVGHIPDCPDTGTRHTSAVFIHLPTAEFVTCQFGLLKEGLPYGPSSLRLFTVLIQMWCCRGMKEAALSCCMSFCTIGNLNQKEQQSMHLKSFQEPEILTFGEISAFQNNAD